MQKQRSAIISVAIVGLGLAAAAVHLLVAKQVVAAKPEQSSAVFGPDVAFDRAILECQQGRELNIQL